MIIGLSENIAGDSYEGEWVEGAVEGKGVMRYADGDVYEVGSFHRHPNIMIFSKNIFFIIQI